MEDDWRGQAYQYEWAQGVVEYGVSYMTSRLLWYRTVLDCVKLCRVLRDALWLWGTSVLNTSLAVSIVRETHFWYHMSPPGVITEIFFGTAWFFCSCCAPPTALWTLPFISRDLKLASWVARWCTCCLPRAFSSVDKFRAYVFVLCALPAWKPYLCQVSVCCVCPLRDTTTSLITTDPVSYRKNTKNITKTPPQC